MTVTYTPNIVLKDFTTWAVGISILRSDNSTDPPKETVYVILSALAATAQNKLDIAASLKTLIAAQDAKQIQIDSTLAGLETQLKSELETREATR